TATYRGEASRAPGFLRSTSAAREGGRVSRSSSVVLCRHCLHCETRQRRDGVCPGNGPRENAVPALDEETAVVRADRRSGLLAHLRKSLAMGNCARNRLRDSLLRPLGKPTVDSVLDHVFD